MSYAAPKVDEKKLREIPPQLQNPEFRFNIMTSVKENANGDKIIKGLEKEWQKKNYSFDSEKLKQHLKTHKLYGVIGGYGNLCIIDLDKKSPDFKKVVSCATQLPETYTIETANGGLHLYYFCKNAEGRRLKNSAGEIRFKNMFVFAPGTEIGKKKYKAHNTLPIAEISFSLIEKTFSKWLSNTTQEEHITDKTRSGIEYAEVSKLLRQGKTKEEIFEHMKAFAKWNERKAYQEATYNKAVNDLQNTPSPHASHYTHNKIILKDLNWFHKLKKEKRFLIKDFLYPQTLNMLYSPPAQFKSLIALYGAIQISRGKDFFGLKTKKYPVLLCDKENNDQIIKDRIEKFRRGENVKSKKFPLWFITREGDLLNPGFLENLKAIIEEKKIKLVIFDTLHRFADYEENKADDINRLYMNVFQPILENDCAILFLHHTTKEGNYRGSSDLLGMVDTAYSIKRKGKTGFFDLINEKNRMGEIEKISGEIDFGADYFKVSLSEELAEEEQKDKIKFIDVSRKILCLYSIEGQEQIKCDIDAHFEYLQEKDGYESSKRTINNALSWLVNKNWLTKPKRGVYKRNWEGEMPL